MQGVRRRRVSNVVVLDLLGLVLFVSLAIIVYTQWRGRTDDSNSKFITPSEIHGGARERPRAASIAVSLDQRTNNEHCTMGACFDVNRCTDSFKVYVYPDREGSRSSQLHQSILEVIRGSSYYTSDPTEACVFVPSFDTLDRDSRSTDYLKNMPPLSTLEHWNGGRNHLIFNQFSGTWPDYSDQLDFDTGQAIIAKASFNMSYFRRGFDVSLPLLHKDHPERGGKTAVLQANSSLFPIRRKYLLAFKGKRYLYGTGTEARSSLYHLHNGQDVLMLTTCKHNKDWAKHQDQRCAADNDLYDKYDYVDLLVNSSFCLVPRGRRLGSFRFLEALQAACVPVSLSNGYVLPFDEVIDWSKASLSIDERRLLQVTSITRGIPSQQLVALRLQTQLLWDRYFKSVEAVVMTTLEIIRNRLNPKPSFVWNQHPGGLVYDQAFNPRPSAFPFSHTNSSVDNDKYTVVITSSRPATRETSPLISLIKAIAEGDHLDQIIVLWLGAGPARVSVPSTSVPVRVVRCEGCGQVDRFWPLDYVSTDAVLHLTEGVEINSNEVEFGFAVWKAFRDRLVGYVAHRHYWDGVRLQWGYSSQPSNQYSIVLSGMIFMHRYYGYLLHQTLSPQLTELANQNIHCLDIVLNFLVSDTTRKRPIKISQHNDFTKTPHSVSTATMQRTNQERIACLNMVANAYGHVPLRSSLVRADPVLFKDSVSIVRKEYRQLELD